MKAAIILSSPSCHNSFYVHQENFNFTVMHDRRLVALGFIPGNTDGTTN